MRLNLFFRSLSTLLLVAFCAISGQCQDPVDPRISKEIAELEQRLQALQDKLKTLKDAAKVPTPSAAAAKVPVHLDKLLTWRPIGPANMSGRITGLAVFEADPTCYYVATASGGLLKTVNNASTFSHQFDRENTVSLGAVAVAPSNRDIVWVGTGEANPRNSVSFGDGVYQSTDGGKTWKNKGLEKSFQIGKIVIHPKDPSTVYVAALGRLYGPSEQRGLYKTTDGGNSWQRVWYLDNMTGALDLVMCPSNPDIMLLASWQRQRDAFDSFVGDAKIPSAADMYAPAVSHGPGSGVYKSMDGGKTWTKLTHGLPSAHLGRIGLDWHRQNSNLVFAIIDSADAGMGLAPAKGFLGIIPENTPQGVRIADVQKGSPAAKAKLSKGDLVLELAGKNIKITDDYLLAVQPHNPGDKIKLIFRHEGQQDSAEITLSAQPGTDAEAAKRGSLGVQAEETEDGVILSEVIEQGAAHKAGLEAGDLLLTVEGTEIGTMPLLFKTLRDKKIGDSVKLVYQRGVTKREITITLEAAPSPPGRPFAGRLGGQRANVQDLQGPNSNKTGGIYKSMDGGDSWTRVNSLNERPFYFSVVRCDPNDEKTVYALGVVLYRSSDGGKTFSDRDINTGVHSDLHDLWINPKDSRHLLMGTDGGIYVSYDRGAHWESLDYLALGQFYHVAADTRRPYHVYGGLQDNGSWGGPSQTLRPSGPTNGDFRNVQGGDGFVCQVDPSDPDVVYSESQNGVMFRRNLRTGESKVLRPKTQMGAGKLRFNWNTPFILSHHNSHVFYAGGNYLFRSVKQGEDLKIISPELSLSKHGTVTALAESPKNPDVLWAGTDDGAVWLTRDGGKTWKELSVKLRAAGLPGPRWVASIEASRVAAGRCYLVFDGHRSDDDEPYVFVTEDFGQNWKSLRGNLPSGPTRVLREDRVNPDLLYLGTEFALFASIERGATWMKVNGTLLPTVAVHEVAQPTTANEIVIATHGRSLWVLDVTTLRQLKPEQNQSQLFAPAAVTRWQVDFTHEGMFRTGTRHFVGQNPSRQAVVDYFLPHKADQLSLKVLDPLGNLVRDVDVSKEKEAGLHRITWDLVGASASLSATTKDKTAPKGKAKELKKGKQGSIASGQMKPGSYILVLDVDGVSARRLLTIEPDPRTKLAGVAVDEAEELRRWIGQNP
jgi:photosystem II stability/assembly factor-like uncharacterized protein